MRNFEVNIRQKLIFSIFLIFLSGSVLSSISLWSNSHSLKLLEVLDNHDQIVINTTKKIIKNSQHAEELLLLYLMFSEPKNRSQFFINTARIYDQIALLNEIIQSIEIKKIVKNVSAEHQQFVMQADFLLLQHDQKNGFGPYLLNDQYQEKTKSFDNAFSRLTVAVFELKKAISRLSSEKKERIVRLTEAVQYALYIIITFFLFSISLGFWAAFGSPKSLGRWKTKGVQKEVYGLVIPVDGEINLDTKELVPSLKRIITNLKSSNQKLTTNNKILKQKILKNKLKEKELHKQATFDSLTNVLNRRAFFEKAQEEVERTLRYKTKLSVLMLDIDHFKSVNDNYGHPAGDEVLKKFITAVEHILRNSDFIGRIGGEEFAVLMPETELEKARIIGERIRDRIADITIPIDHFTLRLTVSLGTAEFSDEEKNLYPTMKRADAALYRAKEAGRNRVCIETRA